MWITFALALIACICILLVPGTLVIASLGYGIDSVLTATPVSIAIYAMVGIVAHALGFDGTFTTLAASNVLAAIIGICFFALRKALHITPFSQKKVLSLGLSASFVAVGLLFTGILFIKNLDGPASFLQTSDNVSHLARINIIASSGNCSTIKTSSVFGSAPLNELPFDTEGSFYPALFHIVCGMLVNLFSIPAPMAENVLCTALVGAVFPLGLYSLLERIFHDNRHVIAFALVTMFAGTAFPVRLLTVHAIYSYVLGMCCVPAVMSLVMRAFPSVDDTGAPKLDIVALLCLLLALAGIAAGHPSAVFSAALLAFPYLLLNWIPKLCLEIDTLKTPRIAQLAFVIFAIIAWFLLLEASFMNNVTNFVWYIFHPLQEAIRRVIVFGTAVGDAQYILAVFVIVGLLGALTHKPIRWIAVAYLIVCAQYIANASGDIGLKRAVSGFWYTDPERIFTMIAIYAIPLSSLGLYTLVTRITQFFEHTSQGRVRRIASTIAALGFVALNYYPYMPGLLPGFGTAYEYPLYALEYEEKMDEWKTYTPQEQAFVRKVIDTVGPNALILNMPYDGSAFAASVDGLHAYYRTYANHLVYSEKGETEESLTLRLHLRELVSNPEVQKAVEKTGAQYVLILTTYEYEDILDDTGIEVSSSPFIQYLPYRYEGLDIEEDTPGFELVLQEGDMKLFKIDQAA